MDFPRSSKYRTVGVMPRQDHSTRRLLIILGLTAAGLAAIFWLAFVVARVHADYDNQELPPASSPSPGERTT